MGGRFAGMLVALSVVAAACTVAPPGPDPTPPEDVSGTCHTLAVGSCLLPFPSDQWTVADPGTPTGRRVVLDEALLPADVHARLGPGATATELVAGADGFTATSPVIFELPRAASGDRSPVVRVLDAATGESVPMNASFSSFTEQIGGEGRFVVAWPRGRFSFGRTYVALLEPGLVTDNGAPVPAAAGIAAAATAPAGSPLARLRTAVEQVAPGSWPTLLSATSFTVRSEASATRQMDTAAARVLDADHPIRGLVSYPWPIGGIGALVTGQVRTLDFRHEHGLIDLDRPPREVWLDFLMALPATPPPSGGYPIGIYGHGLTASKETFLVIAGEAVDRGMAMVAIDMPHHGIRQFLDGGFVLDLANPGAFGRFGSMTVQSVMDQLSLRAAIEQSFGSADLVGPAGRSPDGRPDIDPGRVHYIGTSMGGILGATFLAYAPEIDSAFLQVPGAGIMDIIFSSILWLLIGQVVPRPIAPGDGHAMVGLGSFLIDHADPANIAERVRASGTPVLVAYGVADGVVPNPASERLISLLDLPLVGPLQPETELGMRREPQAEPGAGPAAVAVDTRAFGAEGLGLGLLAHVSFRLPEAMQYLEAWAEAAVADAG